MPCYYPQAFLALCNAYSFDERDPQTHREFIEILLFWMHENYGNAESIYDRQHRFNVPEPSSAYQREIYNWFISIKDIFEFSNTPNNNCTYHHVIKSCLDYGFKINNSENLILIPRVFERYESDHYPIMINL